MLEITYILLFILFLYIGWGIIFLWIETIPLNVIIDNDVDAVIVHSYKPRNSIVPLRGEIVVSWGYFIAKQWNCPLILSVGKTVPGEKRFEGEIYRDFVLETFGDDIKIITGSNPRVRDSHSEILESYKICLENNYQNICIIALRPHLAARLIRYWKKTNKNNLSTTFVGPFGPLQYHFWEIITVGLELILPPNSKRRDVFLDFVRRKG